MKKIYLIMLTVLLAGASMNAETHTTVKPESTINNSLNEDWTFNGNLNVKAGLLPLSNGSATVTATPNGNTISLSISGLTILEIPIDLTSADLTYDGIKIPKGTKSTAMGYPVTFTQDCYINANSCQGIYLRITGTPSGTITAVFN